MESVINCKILKIHSQRVFPNTPWTFFKAFWQELWFGVDQTVAFLYSFWQMKLPTESPPKPPFFGPRCPTKVHQRRARPPADRCSRRMPAAGAPRNVVCREPRNTGRRRTVKTPGCATAATRRSCSSFLFLVSVQFSSSSLIFLLLAKAWCQNPAQGRPKNIFRDHAKPGINTGYAATASATIYTCQQTHFTCNFFFCGMARRCGAKLISSAGLKLNYIHLTAACWCCCLESKNVTKNLPSCLPLRLFKQVLGKCKFRSSKPRLGQSILLVPALHGFHQKNCLETRLVLHLGCQHQ